MIINTLILRQHFRRTSHGRVGKKLSRHAENAIAKKKLSKTFWGRFTTSNPILTMKRPGNVSTNRALNCTKEMAIQHLDELAEELISCGIFKDAEKIQGGIWMGLIDLRRLFNHDETPQFVDYGVDGTQAGLLYCGKGEECKRLIKENRECVTIMPFVSCIGEVVSCQIIFKGQGLTSQMAPNAAAENIPHLLISTTDNGIQDHTSLPSKLQRVQRVSGRRRHSKTGGYSSDGHSSRFDESVLRFLEKEQIHLFVGPPDTTGVTQLLDQTNQSLHAEYRSKKTQLFSQLCSINHEGFMEILAEIWGTWTNPQNICNAARRVGISESVLDVTSMQQDKFEQAAQLIQNDDEMASSSSSKNTSFTGESPINMRKGSASYWKEKFYSLTKMLFRSSKNTEIVLEDVLGFLEVKKVKPKQMADTTIRVTQVTGSMSAKNVLVSVQKIKEKKNEDERRKEETRIEKQQKFEWFIKSKDSCHCKIKERKAKGFKQCPVCHNVVKSVCSKSKCKVDGTPPPPPPK